LEANYSCPYGGMSIDFAFMDKIIELHAEEYVHMSLRLVFILTVVSMDVVVQPSVPWMSLNEQIKSSGLFFPVDPSPTVSSSIAVWYVIKSLRCVLGANWRYGRNRLQARIQRGLSWHGMLIEPVARMQFVTAQ